MELNQYVATELFFNKLLYKNLVQGVTFLRRNDVNACQNVGEPSRGSSIPNGADERTRFTCSTTVFNGCLGRERGTHIRVRKASSLFGVNTPSRGGESVPHVEGLPPIQKNKKIIQSVSSGWKSNPGTSKSETDSSQRYKNLRVRAFPTFGRLYRPEDTVIVRLRVASSKLGRFLPSICCLLPVYEETHHPHAVMYGHQSGPQAGTWATPPQCTLQVQVLTQITSADCDG
ncbi:hypothetical protein J6590_021478 [Homalodisca vitripennis]|nr:hypothetical protein J6590_021478 [Homalodisca vitripennis]